MKFFSSRQSKVTFSRPKLFCMALCLALSMWYFVVYHETSEIEIALLINYQGQQIDMGHWEKLTMVESVKKYAGVD